MTEKWTDFAAQAAVQWVGLGADIDPRSYRAALRLERSARHHEQLMNDALVQFRHRGVRRVEDFRLLALLSRIFPASSSSTEASKALGLSKAATSARVERFVKDGLATRSSSDHDGRAVEVQATDDGRVLAAECVEVIASVHEHLLSPLSNDQVEELDHLLGLVTSRFV